MIRMVKRKLEQVRIAGQCLPFLHPDQDLYPYLGLLTTLSGNWEPQIGSCCRKSADEARNFCARSAHLHKKFRTFRPASGHTSHTASRWASTPWRTSMRWTSSSHNMQRELGNCLQQPRQGWCSSTRTTVAWALDRSWLTMCNQTQPTW